MAEKIGQEQEAYLFPAVYEGQFYARQVAV